MDITEFYQLIGNMSYTLSRIDFLISNIAVDINYVKSYKEFYASHKFETKIKKLKEHADKFILDQKTKDKFIEHLNSLDKFRIIRNEFIHSIILKNSNNQNEFQLTNYAKEGDNIIMKVNHYEANEIRQYNKDFIRLHNDIYELWPSVKNQSN